MALGTPAILLVCLVPHMGAFGGSWRTSVVLVDGDCMMLQILDNTRNAIGGLHCGFGGTHKYSLFFE